VHEIWRASSWTLCELFPFFIQPLPRVTTSSPHECDPSVSKLCIQPRRSGISGVQQGTLRQLLTLRKIALGDCTGPHCHRQLDFRPRIDPFEAAPTTTVVDAILHIPALLRYIPALLRCPHRDTKSNSVRSAIRRCSVRRSVLLRKVNSIPMAEPGQQVRTIAVALNSLCATLIESVVLRPTSRG